MTAAVPPKYVNVGMKVGMRGGHGIDIPETMETSRGLKRLV